LVNVDKKSPAGFASGRALKNISINHMLLPQASAPVGVINLFRWFRWTPSPKYMFLSDVYQTTVPEATLVHMQGSQVDKIITKRIKSITVMESTVKRLKG
jgi:hypothetical protein